MCELRNREPDGLLGKEHQRGTSLFGGSYCDEKRHRHLFGVFQPRCKADDRFVSQLVVLPVSQSGGTWSTSRRTVATEDHNAQAEASTPGVYHVSRWRPVRGSGMERESSGFATTRLSLDPSRDYQPQGKL